MSYTTMSSKMCAIERVCERKSDGPEFGLLVTSKSNQPKYYFPTHRPPNKDMHMERALVLCPICFHVDYSESGHSNSIRWPGFQRSKSLHSL